MKNKKKPKYIVARGITPWGFKRQVNREIEKGYVCQGGVHWSMLSQWKQAMVLKETISYETHIHGGVMPCAEKGAE